MDQFNCAFFNGLGVLVNWVMHAEICLRIFISDFYSVEGWCERPVLGGRYPYIGAMLAWAECTPVIVRVHSGTWECMCF